MEKTLVEEEALVELLNDYLAQYAEHGENKGFKIMDVQKIEEKGGTNWTVGGVRGMLGSAEWRLVDKVYQEARGKYNLK
jgi:hypothetical protein